jgi:membrane protease YdiL (CAAX protease family)
MTHARTHAPGFPTALALLVALAGPPLFVVVSDRLFGDQPSLAIQIGLQLLYGGLAGFVVWVVIRWERLPLQSIGFRRPDRSTLATAVMLWGALYVQSVLTAPLVAALDTGGLEAGVRELARMPVWFGVLVGAMGGIIEETLYRGYAIERLAALTGRPWLGGAISATVFGLAHVPIWGLGFALAADLPMGIVMTVFYLWRRDLLANAFVHSAGLVVAMLTLTPQG